MGILEWCQMAYTLYYLDNDIDQLYLIEGGRYFQLGQVPPGGVLAPLPCGSLLSDIHIYGIFMTINNQPAIITKPPPCHTTTIK